MNPLTSEISRQVWQAKYRAMSGGAPERAITETRRRVAAAIAATEPVDAPACERRFFEALGGFSFLPRGRIQAGAGTDRRVTLFNCFVMGAIEDSIPGIFRALEEGAVTLQQAGGGEGYDVSTLRPRGSMTRTVGDFLGPGNGPLLWARTRG